ncbi:hypothetical protein TrVE_jg2543 [Triparma verrucosa]|nr:hypothetical protein TrVE_jg2543 [Triparma verrucosa]
MSMRKGRPGVKQTLGKKGSSSNSNAQGVGGGLPGGGEGTWKVTGAKVADLPNEDGDVVLLETNQQQLIDKGTNPAGAVCVGKFDSKLYSFQVNCECCKVPMNKAVLLPPSEETKGAPRLSCNFCGATYNLKTGAPLDDAKGDGVGGNMFGGIVKNLMSSQARKNIKVFALAEDKGNVMINIPRSDLQL